MTPCEVAFSPKAEADLVGIYDWIAGQGSEINAQRFVERIAQFCLDLGGAPERGRRLPQYDAHVRAVGFRR